MTILELQQQLLDMNLKFAQDMLLLSKQLAQASKLLKEQNAALAPLKKANINTWDGLATVSSLYSRARGGEAKAKMNSLKRTK